MYHLSRVVAPLILERMNDGLGAFLKRRRAELGLTQTALADASQLTKSHLSSIEAGKIALPNADIRRRLAEALGVSHLDLLMAAGEITEDELMRLGVEGAVERRPDDWAVKLHDAVNLVYWDAKPELADGLLRVIDGIRRDQAREREARGNRKSHS